MLSGVLLGVYRQLVINILIDRSLFNEMDRPKRPLFVDPLALRVLLRRFKILGSEDRTVINLAAFFYVTSVVAFSALLVYLAFFPPN